MRSWQSVGGSLWDTMRFERWMGGIWSLSLTSQGNRQAEGSHDSFKVHSNRSTEPRSNFEKLHFPLSAADRFPLTQPDLLRLCFSLCRSRYLCFGNVRVTFVMAGGKMCLFSFSPSPGLFSTSHKPPVTLSLSGTIPTRALYSPSGVTSFPCYVQKKPHFSLEHPQHSVQEQSSETSATSGLPCTVFRHLK